MPADVKLTLDKRFYKQAKGIYEKYHFDVGILKDSIHKEALSGKKGGLKTFAGGPARRTSQKPSRFLTSEISEKMRERIGNFYTAPFKSPANKDIRRLVKNFFDLVQGRTQRKRLENTLQAVIRNPILRGDYGSNKALTAKIKGFNRLGIDTGQFFKAIIAKVRLSRVS